MKPEIHEILLPHALAMSSGFAASRAIRYNQQAEPPGAVLEPAAWEDAEGHEWPDTAKGYADVCSPYYH